MTSTDAPAFETPDRAPTMASSFRIALTGDSIVQRRLNSRTDHELLPIFDLVRAADIAFTNLEVVPNDFKGDPALESGGSHFGAPSWVLDELVEAGFDLFATATNHSLDYGIAGLRTAIDELEKRRLSYAGIGLNLEEARRPVYHAHPHGTVALLSCSTTFGKGQEASAQRPDMPGRPGVNPLRHDAVHEVTAAQLAVVKEMAEQLGLEAFRQFVIQLGFRFPPDDPRIVPFGELRFREAATPATRLTAREKDVDGIARWLREARLSADIVIVSFHTHEMTLDVEAPVEFLPTFAKRMIDEGADMVVGHGPHLLRGMEIYKGKPIFYSLGNFIAQNELVPRLPSDSYDLFRADPSDTPGQIYRKRSNDDRKGFPSDRRFWESVVPVCVYKDGALQSIDINPVDLAWREPRHRRGLPRLASGTRAVEILDRFAALSRVFGVDFTPAESGGTLRVNL